MKKYTTYFEDGRILELDYLPGYKCDTILLEHSPYNGPYHRENGPAIIDNESGEKFWILNGKQYDAYTYFTILNYSEEDLLEWLFDNNYQTRRSAEERLKDIVDPERKERLKDLRSVRERMLDRKKLKLVSNS